MRELRQHATRAERVLWSALRALPTFKFRRQHRLGVYVVDFYCARVRLAVELDGSVHDDHQARAYDRARTAELAGLGVRLLRFQNEEVLANVGVVRNRIEEACSILL